MKSRQSCFAFGQEPSVFENEIFFDQQVENICWSFPIIRFGE